MRRLLSIVFLASLLSSAGCLFSGTEDFACSSSDTACPNGQICDVTLGRCVPAGGSDGGGCVPTAGDCNGEDDDCDGATDEADELTGAPECSRTQGVCSGAVKRCEAGGWVDCDAAGYEPFETLCDGEDNDCDGSIDLGPGGAPLRQACGTTGGVCKTGTEECLGGLWGACSGVEPSDELCDGLDNDCDGQTDVGVDPIGCFFNLGVCAGAQVACNQGVFGSCMEAYGVDYQPVETLCDGKDNDCDGLTDEDADGNPLTRLCANQKGVCAGSITACSGGGYPTCDASNFTANSSDYDATGDATCDGLNNDCDDLTDEDYVPTTGCHALGTDGVCADAVSVCAGGVVTCPDPLNFEADETSCDGLNNDCDTETDENCGCTVGDPDQACGSDEGECVAGTQACVAGTWGTCSGTGPAAEACDGLDNDCDTLTDETFEIGNPCTVGVGACANTGVWQCVAGDPTARECTAVEGTGSSETCDGTDEDCDGATDEDQNGDALVTACPYPDGVCAGSTTTCAGGAFPDCIYPGTYQTVEQTCDGLDNDCDGLTDTQDALVEPCDNQNGVCLGSTKACGGAGGWLTCGESRFSANSSDYEHVSELSCDGLDNDCDGLTDEKSDSTPLTQACAQTQGVCAAAYRQCSNGIYGSCVYPSTYETTETTCDGLDNDCDGLTDDADPDLSCACLVNDVQNCPLQQGVCAGAQQTCDANGNWSSCAYGTDYQTTETACDGKDNDCDGVTDGTVDNGTLSRTCPNQDGVCAGTRETCTGANTWSGCDYATQVNEYEQPEVSCDGLDNDCDKTIDGLAVSAACPQGGLCEYGFCQGASCQMANRSSGSSCGVGCQCGSNGVALETGCVDGVDNDNDGLTDCYDPNCAFEFDCQLRCGDARCSAPMECNKCQECARSDLCSNVTCGDGYCDLFGGECGVCTADCGSGGTSVCGNVTCALGQCRPDDGMCTAGCSSCASSAACQPSNSCTDGVCNVVSDECDRCSQLTQDCPLFVPRPAVCQAPNCYDGVCAAEIGECRICKDTGQDCQNHPYCSGTNCGDGICNVALGECTFCNTVGDDCVVPMSSNLVGACVGAKDSPANCAAKVDGDGDGLAGCEDPDCEGATCGTSCGCSNGRCETLQGDACP
ncbi:MAG: MopE-related protein [Deltaproteobacteria bacterium]|nr:MopE-related protein [Deltaproteobacteria bacterium]